MGTCAVCEDIMGEELGIENLEWYRWWKWTWKTKLWWYKWRHDVNDHCWEWRVKLRMVWAYNIYYHFREKWLDRKFRTTHDKLVEFYCRGCNDFMFRHTSSKECYKCGGLIKRKKSTVEDMKRLTRRLDEERVEIERMRRETEAKQKDRDV